MSAEPQVRDVVIVGGGTAGWMAAAALAKVIGTSTHTITLIESDLIGTVGVGEATIPPITLFNKLLGFNEDEFIRETNATFKLGIEFIGWGREDHSYIHPFGLFGVDLGGIAFSHHWLRWVKNGGDPDNHRFCVEAEAGRLRKFMRTPEQAGRLPKINYAFHFDASLYGGYLRRYAEGRGVKRTEGQIVEVKQNPGSGHIESVVLKGGRAVRGDFFIDCSGFRGLLIEETLKAGYDDWSRWLPANRAAAMPCARVEDPVPMTRSTVREAGWQWRIPLQHRTGNGYVFSSEFISEDEAATLLSQRLDGPALAEPRVLKFVTGRRRASWSKNVVALGLASGFLEPLESTSIHLVQRGIEKLLAMFPKDGFDPRLIERYNDHMALDYERIRDFIIAHYKVMDREDTPLWRYCKHMSVPDSLDAKLHWFRTRGEVYPEPTELFQEMNWFAILYGQGMRPQGYHPIADAAPDDELRLHLANVRNAVLDRLKAMPSHQAFIERHCAAEASA
ncbi:MAG TPA: tryptophan halogenase family protein [Caulobacteraceae bacterium]|jgi:tryptophan halogenase